MTGLGGKSHHASSASKCLARRQAQDAQLLLKSSSPCGTNQDSYISTLIFTTPLFHQYLSAVKSVPKSSPQLSFAPLNFPRSIPPKILASDWSASARNGGRWLVKTPQNTIMMSTRRASRFSFSYGFLVAVGEKVNVRKTHSTEFQQHSMITMHEY